MIDQPLVCKPNAIPSDERERHGERWAQLLGRLIGQHGLADGFCLTLPVDNDTLHLLMEVVANERLCCPFLRFTITLEPAASTATLTLTGPDGTRELLTAELGLG